MTALVALAAVFGAIVGSFLNVVIHRLPRGEPLGLFRKSRSQCPSCEAQIAWYDNLPLLSYLVLRGRCRACRERISWRYPLVEGVTAALFAWTAVRIDALGWTPPLVAFFLVAGFAAVLVAASAIDFAHKILPDALTLKAGPVFAALGAIAVPGIHGTEVFGATLGGMKPGLASLVVGVVGAAVGGGAILLIRWLGTLIMRKEAMGLGDAKLMAMAGLLLGPEMILIALLVAMVVGAVLGMLIWAVTRDKEIPFGPFLALGVLAVLFHGAAVEHFIFVEWPSWFVGGPP